MILVFPISSQPGLSMTKDRWIIVLCWLWVALVAAYAIWSAVTYSGPYRWLAEWQVSQAGSYSVAWTAMIPAIIVAGPAVLYATVVDKRAAATRAPRSIAERDRANWRIVAVCALIAFVGLAGAGATIAYIARQPTLSDPVQIVDFAKLGAAPAPLGHVRLVGAGFDATRAIQVGLTTKTGTKYTLYAPIVPADAAGKLDTSAPPRVFLRRWSLDGKLPAPEAVGDPEGLLVAGGPPGEIAADFARQGVQIGAPAYVLSESAYDANDSLVTIVIVFGIVALVGVLVTILAIVGARRGEIKIF